MFLQYLILSNIQLWDSTEANIHLIFYYEPHYEASGQDTYPEAFIEPDLYRLAAQLLIVTAFVKAPLASPRHRMLTNVKKIESKAI